MSRRRAVRGLASRSTNARSMRWTLLQETVTLDGHQARFRRRHTPRIGQWVSGLRLAAVPADVVAHLKLCMLDSIGCGLYGAAPTLGPDCW